MIELNERTILYKAALSKLVREGIFAWVDGGAPNWITTDQRGSVILDLIDGKRTFSEIEREYAAVFGLDPGRSWLQVHRFVQDAKARGMVFDRPIAGNEYRGRIHYLEADRLRELWIHTNNSCNLSCTHCLVSSHPGGDPGLSTDRLMGWIGQASDLGVFRFYFTGGEPFIRKDIFDLIEEVTRRREAELIILTNAMLFTGERLEGLRRQDRRRLKLQVSLDGSTAAVNDPIRGVGSFEATLHGLKTAADLGFDVSLTAVVTSENMDDLVRLPAVAAKAGAKSIHLMWPHRRGRILSNFGSPGTEPFPTTDRLAALVRQVGAAALENGVILDNVESLALRVNGRPGVKYDLGNACWDSLCIYSDGHVYPSAALASHGPVDLGDIEKEPLKAIWIENAVSRRFRAASLAQNPAVSADPFRFILGGGDIEHGYLHSGGNGLEGLVAPDPYYGLYRALAEDAMFGSAARKRREINGRTGFSGPVIYHAMGEEAIACGSELVASGERDVATLHSNCVLSFDVEKPHRLVREFYGHAADEPQQELCCPIQYDAAEIDFIPREVLDRFYGCGSPVLLAAPREGQSVVDLGSGGGIDCFIAAKKVGPTGRVVGVDMTDQMLGVAERNKKAVSRNLGYDVVEFKKGFLESVPLEDASVDIVTSNCVINLSPDKRRVFAEIWRILKDHGKAVLSDIVSTRPVPPRIRVNPKLWGECLAGALTEDEFLSHLERAGLYGLEVIRRTFWKEVEGYAFYSVTVRGFKFEKTAGCTYIGQQAIYRGPWAAVVDDEGHLFPRNVSVEICTDTAAKLSAPPYLGQFRLEGVGETGLGEAAGSQMEPSEAAEGACGPGCC